MKGPKGPKVEAELDCSRIRITQALPHLARALGRLRKNTKYCIVGLLKLLWLKMCIQLLAGHYTNES